MKERNQHIGEAWKSSGLTGRLSRLLNKNVVVDLSDSQHEEQDSIPALVREAPALRLAFELANTHDSELDDAIGEAQQRELEAEKAFYDPETSIYPPPLILGPQEYRSPKIWEADWRRCLSDDSLLKPKNEEDFVKHGSPESRATIEAMMSLGIPGVTQDC